MIDRIYVSEATLSTIERYGQNNLTNVSGKPDDHLCVEFVRAAPTPTVAADAAAPSVAENREGDEHSRVLSDLSAGEFKPVFPELRGAPAYSAPFTTDVPQCCGDPATCNDPCQLQPGERPDPNDIQGWAVTINVNAVDILTIGHNAVSGIEGLDDFAPVVRNCADHLLAFIGNGDAQPDEREAFEALWHKARNAWLAASRHGTQEEADAAAIAVLARASQGAKQS